MKSIIVFFKDEDCFYGDKILSDEKSCRNFCAQWAEKLDREIYVIKSSEAKTVFDLFSRLSSICDEASADYIIFTYDDLPFLNLELTEKLIETHETYKAEYTFSDGYAYGFSPELLAAGTIKILYELCKTTQKSQSEKKISRTSIFDLIKTDINAFEIESLISDQDWRLYRFAFSCEKKENFLACKELFSLTEKKDPAKLDVNELSEAASKNPKILKTVPGFYNIQIADACSGKCTYCPYPKAYEEKNQKNPCGSKNVMKMEEFSELVDRISDFSEKAVICLSAWGEAFNHPQLIDFVEKVLSYNGLSVFIETDGTLVTEEFCQKLKTVVEKAEARTNGWEKIMFAISIDAFSAQKYEKIRQNSGFEKAVASVQLLSLIVPGCVYPQFVRMNENEDELEGFFRYWKEKSNASGGNLIIQKYDDFAKLLPECKPADLAPLERNVCWHLRRDFTILRNGDVPLCKEYLLDGIVGNVFSESLEEIWAKFDSELEKHIENAYCEKCRKCDESYTYSF